jgi:hypothetical protein
VTGERQVIAPGHGPIGPRLISRADAKAQGLRLFYTGIRCPRFHDSPRRVHSGRCEACAAETRAKVLATKKANEDKLRARMEAMLRPRIEREVRQELARDASEARKEAERAAKRSAREAARAAAKLEAQRIKRREARERAKTIAAEAPPAAAAVLKVAEAGLQELEAVSFDGTADEADSLDDSSPWWD